MSAPEGGGGGGGGVVHLPQLLPYEAVFRIEVSLSSQTTSAIVMRTTARLYSLEGAQSGTSSTGDREWQSMACGAPCIQLLREEEDVRDLFTIRIVIAEVESGISLWETDLKSNSHYTAMQSNFHTFSVNGCTYAIQFAREDEAARMLESMYDLLQRKQKLMTVDFHQRVEDSEREGEGEVGVFKKPRAVRRLTKKEISSPCNFKHVSGITMQRTASCEQELRGTIQRKMRSLSLSALYCTKPKGPAESSTPSPRQPNRKIGKKFGSFRSFRRKPVKEAQDGGGVVTSELRQEHSSQGSFPSHLRVKSRPQLSASSFNRHSLSHLSSASSFIPSPLSRIVSRSSENMFNNPSSDFTHSPTSSGKSSSATSEAVRHHHHTPTSLSGYAPATSHTSSSGHTPSFAPALSTAHASSSGHTPSYGHTPFSGPALSDNLIPAEAVRNWSCRMSADHTHHTPPLFHPSLNPSTTHGPPTSHGPPTTHCPPTSHGPATSSPPTTNGYPISHAPPATHIPPATHAPPTSRPVSMAISSCNVIGWTPDGKLIVQMPSNGSRREFIQHSSAGEAFKQPPSAGGEARPTPSGHLGRLRSSRSVETLQLNRGPPNSGDPASHQLSMGGLSSQHQPPGGLASRPLPLTPLDVAMPHSQILRRTTYIPPPGTIPRPPPGTTPRPPPGTTPRPPPGTTPRPPPGTTPRPPPGTTPRPPGTAPTPVPCTTYKPLSGTVSNKLPDTPYRPPSGTVSNKLPDTPYKPLSGTVSNKLPDTPFRPPAGTVSNKLSAARGNESPSGINSGPVGSVGNGSPSGTNSGPVGSEVNGLVPSSAELDELQEVTELMNRALEQFDSLLSPDSLAHTSF